jgi:3-oxoacyl-[acyl-carrier protein] reductase
MGNGEEMMSGFKDKKILVTGSTRGIGLAIAETLAEQGAVVGIHGRDEGRTAEVAGTLTAKGFSVLPVAADLGNPEEAVGLIKRFVEQAGSLDGLVNNAGGGKAVAFRGMKLEDWRNTFSANLEAAMLASREAYVLMRKRKQGCIVNVASIAAHGPGKWMGADYAASKAGLVSLTKTLAFEAGRLGIRVNAVSPGMVTTDMTASLSDEMKQGLGIPLGRLAKPEEIASVVCFLLSSDSSYITGQVLHVNGGLLI